MLEQHIEYTHSIIAKKILNNWDSERKHFKFAIPLWLYKTQTAEYLGKTVERKAIIEELSIAYAQEQIAQVKLATENQQVLFDGKIPEFGEIDTALAFKLVNSFAVIQKSLSHAKDQLIKSADDAEKAIFTEQQISQQADKIILQRPRKIQDDLVKTSREAYSNYSDEQLAVLLANKRLNDYKTALSLRDVQSIYSIGSTAWIIEQDKVNKKALVEITDIEEYMAGLTSLEIVQGMKNENQAA
jgi:glutamate synthase (NADPH/NADH) large chain